MLPWLIAGFHLAGLLAMFHAIMTGRTSQGTIGWVVALIAFPYLAVPAYLIFGPYKFTTYALARRAGNAELQHIVDRLQDEIPEFLVDSSANPATSAAERLAEMPITRHNDARLLVDGEATFEAIFAGIDEAQEYVLVQFYIIKGDELGNELKRRLLEKVRQGVKAWLLYDDVGSGSLPGSYVKELRDAGVQVSSFSRRRHEGASFLDRFRLNSRNHRKIVVVDGKKAWVGGHNVGDEYVGKDKKLTPWRDTHVEVEGPVVMGVQLSFVEDWYWGAGNVPDIDWKPWRSLSSDKHALVMPTGPADVLETCTLAYVHAISSARERVWIASPYFVPDDQVIAALQLAVLRGVDVRVLTTGMSDNMLVWLAGWSYLPETDGAGVEVHHFGDGFLHQKVILVDDEFCGIGTANFDNRSFRINFEVSVLFGDAELASQVEAMLEHDFARSKRVTLAELQAKPWWFRLSTRVARLFSPIL